MAAEADAARGGGVSGNRELPLVNELLIEMRRLSALIDKGVVALRDAAVEHAIAEDEFENAKARAWLSATGTEGDKKAHTALAVSKERRRALMSKAMEKAASYAVNARQSQMSGTQSVARAVKADIDLNTFKVGG